MNNDTKEMLIHKLQNVNKTIYNMKYYDHIRNSIEIAKLEQSNIKLSKQVKELKEESNRPVESKNVSIFNCNFIV